jgi:hypothetical protein
MSILDKIFKKNIDQTHCNNCKKPFETIQSGFYFGGAGLDIGSSILRMRKGCSSCGVPVCFDCSAAAADRKGMRGHCICPKCGASLDS